jgi:hypothetical protein
MRGKKSYNIRNVEAHINNFASNSNQNVAVDNREYFTAPSFLLNRRLAFQTQLNTLRKQTQPNLGQDINEYINAKYGVSKYASNLVSGKMFKSV